MAARPGRSFGGRAETARSGAARPRAHFTQVAQCRLFAIIRHIENSDTWF